MDPILWMENILSLLYVHFLVQLSLFSVLHSSLLYLLGNTWFFIMIVTITGIDTDEFALPGP